ncbi:MAG: bifunctional diaminohydroxyphosphoribosylaminopyrimidine deaminase/5-amino-6-(5-phosphoribosylamino)uracil reductase RibD [Gammaproteobacteria bacterium]|nr:MAG: bifunctional diaminohydroxyphosphoribosylaminopyrimidine deaminase/5-amino-6-(5-phosphoribosylamino)uracil reductase RibD [Gammaproteobacteria bacterium]
MSEPEIDAHYMARALHLARRGLYTTDPNPRVGCVLVRGDVIVGEGWHARSGGPHAEVGALEAAGDAGAGATAYVTLEPCCHHGRTPPCTDALLNAGIARVVMATRDPNPAVAGQGQRALEAAGVGVLVGVLEADAEALNVGFFRRMRRQRPYLRSKIAASLDGRTALANGDSQWITGAAARADVQRLRARSSAILTGVGTILADDPSLNVRAAELAEAHQPLRVIADSSLRTPVDARTLGLEGGVMIMTISGDVSAHRQLADAGADIQVVAACATDARRVDLDALLVRLAEREINEVLVEAGAGLNGALLRAGLIDELIVYIAGSVLGDTARGMFDMPGLANLSARPEFTLADVRKVGTDLRVTYTRA